MSDPIAGTRSPVFRWPAFLDRAHCEHIRRAMDDGVAEDAEVIDATIVRRRHVRRTRSIQIDDGLRERVEARFDETRQTIAAALARSIGDREGTAFLRYGPGDFYRAHRDRGDVAGWPDARRRAVAVVLFLNDSAAASAGGFRGGTLRLYPEGDGGPIDIEPETGLLVAFPADLLHEVRPVVSGIRDVAVDWFYDPSC